MSLIYSDFEPSDLVLQPATPRVYARHFDVEEMYQLVEEYTDRVDGISDVDLTITKNNFATLTIFEKGTNSVKVYHTELTPEVFGIMDRTYSEAIENATSHADDYWDRWEAMCAGLEPTIVDMEFFSDSVDQHDLIEMGAY